jgi:hypothetical protein
MLCLAAACAQHCAAQRALEDMGDFEAAPFLDSQLLKWAYENNCFRESGALNQNFGFGTFTFLTGGVVYTKSVAEEHKAIAALMVDVARNASPLPLVCNVGARSGVRVFFELDLDECLPKADELKHLLSVIYTAVEACFPSVNAPRAFVSACAPRAKKNDKIGVGYHIVFSDLIVHPSTLRSVVAFVRDSLERQNVRFALALDANPVKSWYATLRPDGVPKRKACGICALRERYPYLRAACTSTCFRGSIFPLSSVYSLRFFFARSLAKQELEANTQCATWSATQQLQHTLITPAAAKTLFQNLTPCSLSVENSANALDCKYLRQGNSQTSAAACVARETCALIRRIFPEYKALSYIKQFMYTEDKIFAKSLDDDLKRQCLIKKGTHKSNEVYFIFNLKTYKLSFNCFDADCRAKSLRKDLSRSVEKKACAYVATLLSRCDSSSSSSSSSSAAASSCKRKASAASTQNKKFKPQSSSSALSSSI